MRDADRAVKNLKNAENKIATIIKDIEDINVGGNDLKALHKKLCSLEKDFNKILKKL